MNNEIQRCYHVLELEPGASLHEVKQAWRELVKVWHPDRFAQDPSLQNKAQERLKEINCAYDVLQGFLGNGPPPPHNNPATSQSGDTNQQQARQRSESESKRTEPQMTLGAKWATAFVVIAFPIVILIILVNAGGNSSQLSVTPSGNGSGSINSRNYVLVSKALDEKNGYKDFRFGMTPEEIRSILPPSEITDSLGVSVRTFVYRGSPANRIGDYFTDYLRLDFYEGRLYRINLLFSSSQNEIYDAFKVNYGEPFDDDPWMRGDQQLRAKAWRGQKVYAAFLSLPGQLWDSAVILNIETSMKAQEYAAKEPERAAKDFRSNGFKSLVMGMKLQDVPIDFKIVQDDQASGVKTVIFKRDVNLKSWWAIGFYPVESVSANFIHDKLYRIDLQFAENPKEIFKAFELAFGQLTDIDTWTRGSGKLMAKSAKNAIFIATILAPQNSYEKSVNWDTIVLVDVGLSMEAEQFKKDAPKRAAEDF